MLVVGVKSIASTPYWLVSLISLIVLLARLSGSRQPKHARVVYKDYKSADRLIVVVQTAVSTVVLLSLFCSFQHS